MTYKYDRGMGRKMASLTALWLAFLLLLQPAMSGKKADFMIGTGIYDATGPINDIKLMGYANPSQVASGLHQRLRARAFVAFEKESGKRFAFVSLDAGMGGHALKNRVVEKLQSLFGKATYSHDNVAISGTHTHAGPSGYLQYTLLRLAGSGWQETTINIMVKAVVESVRKAHQRLIPALASTATGELHNANINRSPTAYENNPAEERAMYKYNTDHDMTMVKFVARKGGRELGMFNWFAVHPTSLNNTNLLVSGDNKGYASYLFERWKNGPTNTSLPGLGDFVAAFCSSNLGDVSPNIMGPHCRDTGLPCDLYHSTCKGRNKQVLYPHPHHDDHLPCSFWFSAFHLLGSVMLPTNPWLFPLTNTLPTLLTVLRFWPRQ